MKKIISLIMISVFVFGLCACNSQSGKVEPSELQAAQMKIIDSFNISIENEVIVGFQGENDHLKYIFVEYDDGVKFSEKIYYLCFNESVYKLMSAKFRDMPGFSEQADKCCFSFDSDMAITGSYENDLKRIEGEYRIK